ncbi:MAG: DUF2721 domain-containing protein [Calditrichaeota bacterium]|nr:DUF2721 domain-containing protein [Calditrichota bacterium]
MPTQPLDLVAGFVVSAIGPVVLISGVGLLILSTTNRLSHLIDRIRYITDQIRKSDERQPELEEQLVVLMQRTRLLRRSLLMYMSCIFLDAATVIMLFVLQLLRIDFGLLIATLFSLSLLALIAGILFFTIDVKHNLDALEIESHRAHPPAARLKKVKRNG